MSLIGCRDELVARVQSENVEAALRCAAFLYVETRAEVVATYDEVVEYLTQLDGEYTQIQSVIITAGARLYGFLRRDILANTRCPIGIRFMDGEVERCKRSLHHTGMHESRTSSWDPDDADSFNLLGE